MITSAPSFARNGQEMKRSQRKWMNSRDPVEVVGKKGRKQTYE